MEGARNVTADEPKSGVESIDIQQSIFQHEEKKAHGEALADAISQQKPNPWTTNMFMVSPLDRRSKK
jgi:hypothetical protein